MADGNGRKWDVVEVKPKGVEAARSVLSGVELVWEPPPTLCWVGPPTTLAPAFYSVPYTVQYKGSQQSLVRYVSAISTKDGICVESLPCFLVGLIASAQRHELGTAACAPLTSLFVNNNF
jgi:hypothetical protein